MSKAFRMVLLLTLLGATTACRQAVKVVVAVQSDAALTQSTFRDADVVAAKKSDKRPAVRKIVPVRREPEPAARFAMTITVTPPCSNTTPTTVLARRS
jgi:hypothetical protein